MKVNGNDVSWGLIIFLVSAIATGGVSYWKIETNTKVLTDHEKRIRALEKITTRPYPLAN